jgi:hypothetical protein
MPEGDPPVAMGRPHMRTTVEVPISRVRRIEAGEDILPSVPVHVGELKPAASVQAAAGVRAPEIASLQLLVVQRRGNEEPGRLELEARVRGGHGDHQLPPEMCGGVIGKDQYEVVPTIEIPANSVGVLQRHVEYAQVSVRPIRNHVEQLQPL